MITAEDTIDLCSKLADFKKYLKKQMSMHEYLEGRLLDTEEHKFRYDSYNNALDKFHSLFGEETP